MAAALPGARGLFSQMQLALRTDSKHRNNLSKGVHAALDDFRYLHKDIENRPTKMQEIVPLDSVLSKYHDALGFACGGVVNPNNTAVSRQKTARASFPISIQKRLVSFKNPTGDITNSDLELVTKKLTYRSEQYIPTLIICYYICKKNMIISSTARMAVCF